MEKYLNLRGHQIYSYEWGNNGEPLLLLHGGLSQTSHWDYVLTPKLEENFHIYGYDRTGHGFTGDREGSFHFAFQRDEAIAYLEDVIKGPAHLVGYSDGGIISLMVALARPDLVKSIVAIGSNYHYSGTPQEFAFEPPSEEDQAEYNLTSPDAPHTLSEKIQKMLTIWKSEPTMSVEDISQIKCPVLILVGDDDVITHEHTLSMYRSIPQSQLAIIPGAGHQLPKEKPELFSTIVHEFLLQWR